MFLTKLRGSPFILVVRLYRFRNILGSLKLRSAGLFKVTGGGGTKPEGRNSGARPLIDFCVVRDTISSSASSVGPGEFSKTDEHCAAQTSSRNTASRPASRISWEQSCTRSDAHWACNRTYNLNRGNLAETHTCIQQYIDSQFTSSSSSPISREIVITNFNAFVLINIKTLPRCWF